MKQRKNQGITLIALVITIIVLLILAGVSIAMLSGQNGILNQVTGAKDANNKGAALEKVQTEVMGSYGQDGSLDITKLNENLNHIKGIQGTPIATFPATVTVDGYEIEIKANGEVIIKGESGGEEKESVTPGEKVETTIKDNYIDSEGNKATVPAGFTVSGIENEQKINSGLVIYDIPDVTTVNWTEDSDSDGVPDVQTKYNQFVWIPVDSSEIYQRNFTYPSSYKEFLELTPEGSTVTDTNFLPEGIQPVTNSAEENENAERETVVKYNGFYMTRYEAGKEDETVVSKQGKTVWNNISQTEAKITAKTMYNNTNVKSALCSGIQWDMVMKFIDKKNDAEGNLFDVRKYSELRHTDNLATTGKNNYDKVQNIYDLEGNCREWVAEIENSNTPIYRSDSYLKGESNKTSKRTKYEDLKHIRSSFRNVLYVI